MSGTEIAILIVVCVAFAGAVAAIIYGKVKHKGGCCDCSGCNGACGWKAKTSEADGASESPCDGNCPHCAMKERGDRE